VKTKKKYILIISLISSTVGCIAMQQVKDCPYNAKVIDRLYQPKIECRTDDGNLRAVSTHVKTLVTQAAITSQIQPRTVIAVRTHLRTAYVDKIAIFGTKFRGIKINEHNFSDLQIGAQKVILLHEMQHIKHPHFKASNLQESQVQESSCDEAALKLANCKRCSQEFASLNMDNHNKQAAAKKTSFPAIEDAQALSARAKDRELIKIVTQCSRSQNSTHPLPLERALKARRHAQGIQSLCVDHKPKLVLPRIGSTLKQ
jgi:hypothetical protein